MEKLTNKERNLVSSALGDPAFEDKVMTLLKLIHPQIFSANERMPTGTRESETLFNRDDLYRYTLIIIKNICNKENVEDGLKENIEDGLMEDKHLE